MAFLRHPQPPLLVGNPTTWICSCPKHPPTSPPCNRWISLQPSDSDRGRGAFVGWRQRWWSSRPLAQLITRISHPRNYFYCTIIAHSMSRWWRQRKNRFIRVTSLPLLLLRTTPYYYVTLFVLMMSLGDMSLSTSWADHLFICSGMTYRR